MKQLLWSPSSYHRLETAVDYDSNHVKVVRIRWSDENAPDERARELAELEVGLGPLEDIVLPGITKSQIRVIRDTLSKFNVAYLRNESQV